MIKSILSLFMVFSFITINPTLAKQNNGFVSTFEMVDAIETQQAKADMKKMISKKEVQAELADLGVSPKDIEQKIEGLAAVEIAQLDSEIQQAKAGGILVTILLVLAIIYFAQRV